MQRLNVLMKVSESCNLRCSYCYEGDKSKQVMDLETLTNSIKILQTTGDAQEVSYIWHGAEPLTAKLEFYRKAVELQKRFGASVKVSNGMQTNGVLLTPESADFFTKERFGLGFSLDGPKRLHDLTRPYRSGKSSFDATMKAIGMMRERGKSPGVIAVITKKNFPFLDEIYDFFKEEGLNFKINLMIKCGHANDQFDDLSLSDTERAQATCHLFDRWFYDQKQGHTIHYGNMDSLVSAFFTKGGSSCNMVESCQDSFLSIGTDGTLYPCSRFSGPDVSYGNINKITDFQEIQEHPLRVELASRYEKNDECNQCDYNFLCHSGCMHGAYLEGDIMGKDPSCASNKRVYEHIARKVIQQLDKDRAINE
ncbi:radical SAM protein [Candidatus Woesearchaeota archaeon]|jgi:uncharacterized protein|nr:radical SAM protein [Candidatus Woesearchaeota archaeon]MBT5397255.1 radical SAM protein [Candidatus Woesearchaeota archaeon]MBT6367199.1 radical SAM protein [Candidatus Woesearchaeota archaeon]MBT7762655.1 radical SAM protein [Candidatus Woesearchaeota archaeon]